MNLVAIAFVLLEACSSGIGRCGRATEEGEEGEEGKIKRAAARELADMSAIDKALSAHWFFRIATAGA
jgi:hypothetical protein